MERLDGRESSKCERFDRCFTNFFTSCVGLCVFKIIATVFVLVVVALLLAIFDVKSETCFDVETGMGRPVRVRNYQLAPFTLPMPHHNPRTCREAEQPRYRASRLISALQPTNVSQTPQNDTVPTTMVMISASTVDDASLITPPSSNLLIVTENGQIVTPKSSLFIISSTMTEATQEIDGATTREPTTTTEANWMITSETGGESSTTPTSDEKALSSLSNADNEKTWQERVAEMVRLFNKKMQKMQFM